MCRALYFRIEYFDTDISLLNYNDYTEVGLCSVDDNNGDDISSRSLYLRPRYRSIYLICMHFPTLPYARAERQSQAAAALSSHALHPLHHLTSDISGRYDLENEEDSLVRSVGEHYRAAAMASFG